MTDWKEEHIEKINASRKLNDKKKKHMIKLVTKSQETDYKSFFFANIPKLHHIHKNYAKFDTEENRNAEN